MQPDFYATRNDTFAEPALFDDRANSSADEHRGCERRGSGPSDSSSVRSSVDFETGSTPPSESKRRWKSSAAHSAQEEIDQAEG